MEMSRHTCLQKTRVFGILSMYLLIQCMHLKNLKAYYYVFGLGKIMRHLVGHEDVQTHLPPKDTWLWNLIRYQSFDPKHGSKKTQSLLLCIRVGKDDDIRFLGQNAWISKFFFNLIINQGKIRRHLAGHGDACTHLSPKVMDIYQCLDSSWVEWWKSSKT